MLRAYQTLKTKTRGELLLNTTKAKSEGGDYVFNTFSMSFFFFFWRTISITISIREQNSNLLNGSISAEALGNISNLLFLVFIFYSVYIYIYIYLYYIKNKTQVS